ncbi:MAG: B12-binding domain-containing radical SAM protein [Spirochaetales bacterium]|nr:B12-binding domain-containing radical SAM protein [Spirochaetales bacterium]
MKIMFLVPASRLRTQLAFRIGHLTYGLPNPITGPLILGGMLKKEGHDVSVYEELYKDFDFKKLCDSDIIGIYTMSGNSTRAYELGDYFKAKKKKVIIGGMHATALPHEALQHADQVVVGEAESVINAVINGDIQDKIVYAPKIMNLDTIPFPDYSILKTPCAVGNVLTTRGCPFHCIYCSTSRIFGPYRERSIENVLAELSDLKKQGFAYMNFQDDNFTFNKNRAKRLLEEMIERKLYFKSTFFFGRADLGEDEELLSLLQKANFKTVLLGIESINQRTLDDINKKIKIERIRKSIFRLKEYKIKVITSLVLGLDTDTKENIRQSVEFCKEIDAYTLQPAVLTPIPGTELYKQFENQNRIITYRGKYFDFMHVTFIPKRLTTYELQEEFFNSIKSFYTVTSSLRIWKAFGLLAGLKRFALALIFTFLPLYMKHKEKLYFSLLKLCCNKKKNCRHILCPEC